MILTHKIRIYPNKSTSILLNNYFGFSRHIYNRGLAIWNELYSNNIKPNHRMIRDKIKHESFDWYKLFSPQIIDTSIEDLGFAFSSLFRKRNKFPKFKSKKNQKDTIRFYRKSDSSIRVKNNKLFLPKFSYGIKLSEEIRFTGTIKTCTVSKKGNKFFASLTIDCREELKPKFYTSKSAGIDLGIKTFATITDSDLKHEKINWDINLIEKYKYRSKLSKLIAKKEFNSKRYLKAKTKLQLIYLRIRNIQLDFLNKFTTNLVKKYDEITIEELNIKGMKKFKNISKEIHNSLFYNFRLLLTYKCKIFGKKLILADKYFPSTQLCSSCGNVKQGKEKLKFKRIYNCNCCGLSLCRDINASINLLRYKNK